MGAFVTFKVGSNDKAYLFCPFEFFLCVLDFLNKWVWHDSHRERVMLVWHSVQIAPSPSGLQNLDSFGDVFEKKMKA